MNTLQLIKAWILTCSVIVLPSATQHVSDYHNPSHHGDSGLRRPHPNTIVPFGIQIPEHVLSTQDVACISADSNIFEIMNKAQKTCKGEDMRCTFYHFLNHEYEKLGTLDINKELFDDLLMKFHNWLLTAEDIEKDYVTAKTKDHHPVKTDRITVNDSNGRPIDNASNTIQGNDHLDTGLHNNKDNKPSHTDTVYDNRVHSHNPDETHHRNHHHKMKNANHIKLDTEYNNDHRYFEVFIPKDKETGKPRTIYVEIDKDKNEFILLDEDIDKKLKGVKPIKIELDQLSEIADTAFNDIVKSSIYKEHVNSNFNDNTDIASDTYSKGNEDILPSHKDVKHPQQNSFNSPVCKPDICNINTYQKFIPDDTTGNVKKILNVSKNLVGTNKYMNHAQFYVESQMDNEKSNNGLELLENNNTEADSEHADFYEDEPLDTIEFDDSNTNIDIDLDNTENIELLSDNDNTTEHHEFSIEDENVTFDDNFFIKLEENNDTYNDIDFTDAIDESDTQHLKVPLLLDNKPVQEKKQVPKLTTTYPSEMSNAIPSDLHDLSPEPNTPLPPILGKDFAEELESKSNLKSSFPVYATLDSPTGTSQNISLNSDLKRTSFESPALASNTFTSDSSNLQYDCTKPNSKYTYPIFPSPPVECVVRLNKESKYSPLNVGFSWLPTYSRIEEMRLPSTIEFSPQESILQLPVPKNEELTESIAPGLTAIDTSKPVVDQSVSSPCFDVQEPFVVTNSYPLDVNTPMSPKSAIITSKLELPKCNTDFDRTPLTCENTLSLSSCNLKDTVNPIYPFQQNLLTTKPNKELGLINYPSLQNNLKETMTPCPKRNRYPYNTIPYFSYLYLKSPFLEPLLPITPLKPIPTVPTLNSLPITSDQTKPCPNENDSRLTKPLLPIAPNVPFSPLSPLLLMPSFLSKTSPCPHLINQIPYYNMPSLQYNYPALNNNYLTQLKLDQISKPTSSKSCPLSIPEQPCSNKNNIELTPSSYTPFLPVYTLPVQMDINLSLSLERDLQSLSLKYGIPFAKILDSLETVISDSHSTSSLTLEETCPKSGIYNSQTAQQLSKLSTKNADNGAKDRSGTQELLLESDLTTLAPFDSSLTGPHLEIESSLMLDSMQNYTVLSENTVTSPHLSNKNQSSKITYDSSLIGPHLLTLSSSNFEIGDENRIAKDMLVSESDFSKFMHLDSSFVGPNLEIGSPPVIVDAKNFQKYTDASNTDVLITTTSPIQPQIKLNQPKPASSVIKPLINNEMVLQESDLYDFTHLDLSTIDNQVELVKEYEHSEILQHDDSAVSISASNASPKLQKINELSISNTIEGEVLSESDYYSLIPLDSSLVGPHIQTGSFPIIVNDIENKTITLVPEDDLLNRNELESIILPPSLLPTLLDTTAKTDLNVNIATQDTKLKEDGLSMQYNNAEQQLIDIIDKDFKIIESFSTFPNLDDSMKPLLSKDFTTVDDSDVQFDSSLSGPSILHKIGTPGMSSTLKSSFQLDSSLVGPSLHLESEPSVISPVFDSESYLESSSKAATINQYIKSSKTATSFDLKNEHDSFLVGPNLHQEITSHESTLDSITKLDSSLEMPKLQKTEESSKISSYFDSETLLDSSLIGSSLHQELESIESPRAFDSEGRLDHSLTGPHLSNVPFSYEEIQKIYKEFQSESDLTDSILLDSSLIGPHVNLQSGFEQSDISRNQNLELSSVTNPEIYETTDVFSSDLQELSSKFTNPITKSQLLPFESKPCNKLLSSKAKVTDNKNIIPSYTDLQTLTLNTLLNTPLSLQDELVSEFSPVTLTWQKQESVVEEQPCLYFPALKSLSDSPSYIQGLSQIPVTPYSPFLKTKPLTVGNASVPLIPNSIVPLTSDYVKLLLASQGKTYSFLPILNMPTFRDTVALSPEWSTSSNILPLDKYIPSVLQPNLESTVGGSEYNPLVHDDIISLIDKNTLKMLKDMSIFPFSHSSVTPCNQRFDKSDNVYPSLLDAMPILNTDFNKKRPVLSVPVINPIVSSPIYTNPQISLYNSQNMPFTIPAPNILPCNLQPFSQAPLETQSSGKIGPAPELVSLPTTFLESQLPEIAYNPYLIESLSNPFLDRVESLSNPVLDREFLKAPLSKQCLDSPTYLPSTLLDTLLQLPITSNELNSIPRSLPPVYFTSTSPKLTAPTLNAFPNPSSASLKIISLDYPDPSMEEHIRFKPSALSYKPSQYYPSPYLPTTASPLSIDSYSLVNKLTPVRESTKSSAYSDPTSVVSYFSPAPNALTPYLSPPTTVSPHSYSPILSKNILIHPSSAVLPSYLKPISPVSSSIPPFHRPLLSNREITEPELPILTSLNTLPIFDAEHPLLNNKQILIKQNTLPVESQPTHFKKITSLSSPQIKQNIPIKDVIESNLETIPLTEESSYDFRDENTYSNDKDDKYFEEINLKYPLESLSYTLAPEEMTKTLSEKDFIKRKDPIANLVSYSALQSRPQSSSLPQLLISPLMSQLPTLPYIQLPSIYNEPNLNTLTSQNSLIKPTLSFDQYFVPTVSHSLPLEIPITPLTPVGSLKHIKQIVSPQYTPSLSPTQTRLQESIPLNEAPIHYQSYIPLPTALTNSAKKLGQPSNTNLQSALWSSFTLQDSLPLLSSPVPKSSPYIPLSNAPFSTIPPHIPEEILTNHIIPSSLFISLNPCVEIPENKFSSLNNIPSNSSPYSSLVKPLQTVTGYTPSRPIDKTLTPQKSVIPISPLTSAIPVPSLPFLTQPLDIIDLYQHLSHPKAQYITKPNQKISPVSTQYPSLSLTTIYNSIPLETLPNRLINKPSSPLHILPSDPVNDDLRYALPSTKNYFLNQEIKTVSEVPSYSVPFSSQKSTPLDNILLSNLRPLNIPQNYFDPYSSPISQFTPLSSSPLLKPLFDSISPHYSRLQIVPNNSQYISQLPLASVPQLLPSTSPLTTSPLIKPLLPSFQNNAPVPLEHLSSLNTAFSKIGPINGLPSVANNQKYSIPSNLLMSELPKSQKPVHQPTASDNLLKSPYFKQLQPPVDTLVDIAPYPNYNILQSAPNLVSKAKIYNTAKYVESSTISDSQAIPLSNSVDMDTLEETGPYELPGNKKGKILPLPMNLSQQRQFYPVFPSQYFTIPQPSHSGTPSSTYKTSKSRPQFPIPSLIPEEVELINSSDFISLSQTKSEPLTVDSPININTPIYDTSKYKQSPQMLQKSRYYNHIQEASPLYLSPEEYKELTQGTSSQASPSSSSSSIDIEARLTTSPLSGRPWSIPLPALYSNQMSITPENRLPSPTFTNPLPFSKKPLALTPDNENIQTFLNKYRPANKITPLYDNNYAYKPKSSIPNVPSDAIYPLFKSKEPYNKYIEILNSNEDLETESDDVRLLKQEPDVVETKSFTDLPEILQHVRIPYYNNKVEKHKKLHKIDHFYANNHIGKNPQVSTIPNFNTLFVGPSTDVTNHGTTVTPDILENFDNMPTEYLDTVPKLDKTSFGPSTNYPEISNSPENLPITKSYLNPNLKHNPVMEFSPNIIEEDDTFEIPSNLYSSNNNIDNIKYSDFKSSQVPTLKSPKTTQNFVEESPQTYDPSEAAYSSPIAEVKPINIQRSPSLFANVAEEIFEPLIPQYQTPIKKTTPLQPKLVLNTLEKSPQFDEYNPKEDDAICIDDINEDNDLKTSLVSYISKRENIKNDLYNSNSELTLPLGYIGITKKDPCNVDTIETNNPSIGLKVWKSNLKLVKAELKLKFKDVSVNNFMPVINNLDKYDIEEILQLVKNYIDEKYGNHIEVNDPYIVDNKYTVIQDFNHDAVDNKYNLLWPTNYV